MGKANPIPPGTRSGTQWFTAHVQGQFPTLVLDLLHAGVATILRVKIKAK